MRDLGNTTHHTYNAFLLFPYFMALRRISWVSTTVNRAVLILRANGSEAPIVKIVQVLYCTKVQDGVEYACDAQLWKLYMYVRTCVYMNVPMCHDGQLFILFV